MKPNPVVNFFCFLATGFWFVCLFSAFVPTLWVSIPYWLMVSWVARGIISIPLRLPAGEGKEYMLSLLTAGDELVPCKIRVEAGRILVASEPGVYHIVTMDSIAQVLFEDRSTEDLEMAGFSVDFTSSSGSSRFLFFYSGLFAANRMVKIVESILKAHETWYAGCRVPVLPFADMTGGLRSVSNSPIRALSGGK